MKSFVKNLFNPNVLDSYFGKKYLLFNLILFIILLLDVIAITFFYEYTIVKLINGIVFVCIVVNGTYIIHRLIKYRRSK